MTWPTPFQHGDLLRVERRGAHDVIGRATDIRVDMTSRLIWLFIRETNDDGTARLGGAPLPVVVIPAEVIASIRVLEERVGG